MQTMSKGLLHFIHIIAIALGLFEMIPSTKSIPSTSYTELLL